MSFFSSFVKAVGPSLRAVLRRPAGRVAPPGGAAPAGPRPTRRGQAANRRRPAGELDGSPGRSGPDRTVEVRPGDIGAVHMSYSPRTDGDPDPGEIIWTWVPFEEDNGEGKDRPVLVVAAEPAGTVLAVQLTSKNHDSDSEFIAVGTGEWDPEQRPSWVNLERVLRVRPGGMRREATALDQEPFERVTARLRARYGWS